MKKVVAFLLSLLFSTLGFGLPAAQASVSTKTFVITDSDGNPYVGAEVALLEWLPNSGGPVVPTVLATADVSGIAEFDYDSNSGRSLDSFLVLPPEGDVSHANYFDYEPFTSTAQTISVQLFAATAVMQITDAAGNSVTQPSWIYYPSIGSQQYATSSIVLRPGPFGIDLSTDLKAGQDYSIEISPSFWGPVDLFPNAFGLRLLEEGGLADTYSVFTDSNFDSEITPQDIGGASVFSLPLVEANFRGQLADVNDAPITLPDGASAQLSIRKSLASGEVDFDTEVAGSSLLDNGSFAALIQTPTAGKYWPQFMVAGSTSIPSFFGEPFYINGDGNYSLSPLGPFVDSASFVYRVDPPAPNFSVSVSTGDPSLNQAGQISLSQDLGSGATASWGPYYSENSVASYLLADGVYSLNTRSNDPLLSEADYELIVDLGVTTLRTANGAIIRPTSEGSYDLQHGSTNFKVKLNNPYDSGTFLDDVSVNAYRPLGGEDGNWASGFSDTGKVGVQLSDGIFEVTIQPGHELLLSSRQYLVEVVDGQVVSVTNPDGSGAVTPENGFYELEPYVSNLIGSLVDGEGNPVSGSQLTLTSENAENYTYAKANGQFGFYAPEAGTYTIVVTAPNSVDSDVGGITLDGIIVTDPLVLTDLGPIELPKKNFYFSVTEPGDTEILRFFGANLRDVAGGGRQWLNGSSTGISGAYIASAGTYELTVYKPYLSSPSKVATTTYTLTVTGTVDSGFTVSIPNSTVGVDGVFVLELAAPNVTGQIKSPSGATLDLSNGQWANVQAQKYDDASQNWNWTNSYGELDNKGNFGLNLNEIGVYRLLLQPYNIDGASKTYSAPFEATNANLTGTIASFPDLRFSTPTATFKVYPSDSGDALKYVGIEIRKDDQWLDWISTDQNGLATFTAEGTGSYEFVVHPPYNSEAVSKTYAGTVADVDGTLVLTLDDVSVVAGIFSLQLGSPNLTGWLSNSQGERIDLGSGLWVNVMVQKYIPELDFWEWTNMQTSARSDGGFGLTLDQSGTFRLRFEPWGSQDYATTMSEEFTVTDEELATFSATFNDFVLKAPALTGVLYGGAGSTGIAGSQIVPVDSRTGQQLWEYSKWTDQDGRWSLALPEGDYSIFARAPYQSIAYGDSAEITGIAVAADGTTTIDGAAVTSSLTLRLSDPTWTGEVVSPQDSSQKLVNASICLWQSEENDFNSRCTQSDSNGQWALSKWATFDDFNDTSVLTVRANQNPEFAEARYEGEAEIEAVLGAVTSGAELGAVSGIQLKPAVPNTVLTIMAGAAGGSYVWVNVESDEFGWLGGGSSDQNGVVSLNLETLATDFRVNVFIQSRDFDGNYTSTTKAYTQAEVAALTSAGQFSDTINLDTPNFKVRIYEPGVNASSLGDPVAFSWIEVMNETTQEWLRGSSADNLGQAAFRLKAPSTGSYTYRLTVNPGYQNNELLARKNYYAQVNSAGEILVSTNDDGSGPVLIVDGQFPLTLAAPTVRGSVYRPGLSSTRVPDSHVVPIDFSTRWELWEYGVMTNSSGAFGITLPDGTYYLKARAPWDERSLADSTQCEISVVSESLIGDCVVDGQVELRLREPNVNFKLVDENGNPLKYTNVGIGVGNWWANAFSGEDGNISLLIDSAEIAQRNPGLSGSQDIRVWVDPSNSSAVRWECSSGDSKPICAELQDVVIGQDYLPGGVDLGDIQALGPNTAVTVLSPVDGITPIRNSWVTLFYEESGWKRWISSGSTDSSGQARFNVEDLYRLDSEARFSIEIEAPWDSRSAFSRKTVKNLTYAELTGAGFQLGTPNLKVTVKDSDGTSASQWSYIQVEEVDPTNGYAYVSWLNGYGTDRLGVASMNLEAGKTFRLTLYPGHASEGSRTSCIFTVDGVGLVSKVADQCPGQAGEVVSKAITLQLSGGNLAGRIFKPGSIVGVSGAIVFAEAFDGNGDATGETAEAVTNAAGSYALQLDSSYEWKIKVFYVNPPAIITPLASYLTPVVVSSAELQAAESNSTPKSVDITLVAK